MYHRIHFLYDSLNCYFKMKKTTKTEETKEVVSYLIITNVRDALLVRPQKKSSETVSCDMRVQKNLKQGCGYLV